jgi:hypothetical protein
LSALTVTKQTVHEADALFARLYANRAQKPTGHHHAFPVTTSSPMMDDIVSCSAAKIEVNQPYAIGGFTWLTMATTGFLVENAG